MDANAGIATISVDNARLVMRNFTCSFFQSRNLSGCHVGKPPAILLFDMENSSSGNVPSSV